MAGHQGCELPAGWWCHLKCLGGCRNRLPALLFVISDSLVRRNPVGFRVASMAGLPGMLIAAHNMEYPAVVPIPGISRPIAPSICLNLLREQLLEKNHHV